MIPLLQLLSNKTCSQCFAHARYFNALLKVKVVAIIIRTFGAQKGAEGISLYSQY